MRVGVPLAWFGLVVLLTLAADSQADLIIFSDNTFEVADWTAVKSFDNTPGQAGTFNTQQVVAGGNPGKYRSVQLIFSGTGVSSTGMAVLHTRASDVYDPAAGAIATIDFSIDGIVFDNPTPGFAVSIELRIVQNGIEFQTGSLAGFQVLQFDWTNFSVTGLTEADFFTSSPATPDFSASGAPIQFGFVTGATTRTSGITVIRTGGFDNWSVTINTMDGGAIPEPTCVLLTLLGVVALAPWRRKGASPAPGRRDN